MATRAPSVPLSTRGSSVSSDCTYSIRTADPLEMAVKAICRPSGERLPPSILTVFSGAGVLNIVTDGRGGTSRKWTSDTAAAARVASAAIAHGHGVVFWLVGASA